MKSIHQAISIFFVCLSIVLSLTNCGNETPTPTKGHFQMGNEFSLSGDFENAVSEYEQALEDEPENVDALSNLGVAYYNLGQLDEAIEQYSKAIEVAPKDADIRSNLAAAHVQKYQASGSQEQLDNALQEYQKAVELKPSLAQAFYGLGVVYLLLGQNQDAIQAFEEYQKLDTGQDATASKNAQEYLNQLRGP